MKSPVENLLYEALETEIGGVQVYTNALACAKNADLKKEWQEYLEQTKRHEAILRDIFETLGLDEEKETPGRQVVRHIGQALVQAMQIAKQKADGAAAEIVAAECVVLAETKDHLNWELIGEIAKGEAKGEEKKQLAAAHGEVEDEEDEHLYHTTGWTRELWLQTLELPAVLPPPEERRDVKTAIGAALAKKARGMMRKKSNGRERSAAASRSRKPAARKPAARHRPKAASRSRRAAH
jgi:rubrerythrin